MIHYLLQYLGVAGIFMIATTIYRMWTGVKIYVEHLAEIMFFSVFWPVTILGYLMIGILWAVLFMIDFFKGLFRKKS